MLVYVNHPKLVFLIVFSFFSGREIFIHRSPSDDEVVGRSENKTPNGWRTIWHFKWICLVVGRDEQIGRLKSVLAVGKKWAEKRRQRRKLSIVIYWPNRIFVWKINSTRAIKASHAWWILSDARQIIAVENNFATNQNVTLFTRRKELSRGTSAALEAKNLIAFCATFLLIIHAAFAHFNEHFVSVHFQEFPTLACCTKPPASCHFKVIEDRFAARKSSRTLKSSLQRLFCRTQLCLHKRRRHNCGENSLQSRLQDWRVHITRSRCCWLKTRGFVKMNLSRDCGRKVFDQEKVLMEVYKVVAISITGKVVFHK